MARRITPKDGADAVAMLDGELSEVPIPHEYRPIADSPQKSCAECFAIPTDPTFAAHHAMPVVRRARSKRPPTTKKASKAQRVRALLDKGKTVLEISKALDDVSWSYAWDVAAAWEKNTGKTIIAKHLKGGAE